MSEIRVRFAPSPTGSLHIGGARTALFNWVFARQHGGKFFLRVEDTNKEVCRAEYTQSILEGLTWLGLSWDDEIVYQSHRRARHIEVANDLYRAGHAYYCQCPPNHPAETADQVHVCACRASGHTSGALRLRRPDAKEGATVQFTDCVYGTVATAQAQLDDMVLVRTNGMPTYLLGSVVDDYDMGITHVIRGVDHLTNTVRIKQMIDLLEWPLPVFAHLPLIHGSDGKKLSKRHGAVSVSEYKEMGYLPEGMQNALIRMGWGHENTEVMTGQEMRSLFALEAVGKSKAQFSVEKLQHFNQVHMTKLSTDDLLQRVMYYMPKPLSDAEKTMAAKMFPEIIPRSHTLCDIAQFLHVLWPPKELCRDILQGERDCVWGALQSCEVPWTPEGLEAGFRTYAAQNNYKLVNIAQPLRILLTGQKVSPPVFFLMAILGQEEVTRRVVS